MKLLKSFFSLSLILLISYPFTALATETRLNSMGGTKLYTRDNTDIFTFPGTIHQYAGQAVGELRAKGNNDQYSIGFQTEEESFGTFGVYLNNPVDYYFQDIKDQLNYLQNVEIERKIDVFYGRKLTGFDLGLHVSLAIDRWLDEDPNGDGNKDDKHKESAHLFSVGAGVSSDLFDVAAEFDFPGFKAEVAKEEETIGATGIGLNGRMYLGNKEGLEIIPVGQFYIGPGNYKYDMGITGAKTEEIDINKLELALGLGFNYHIDKNNLLILGVKGFGLDKFSYDEKDGDEGSGQTMTLPGVYFGIESQIKPWLTGRFGGSQIYRSTKETYKPKDGKETSESIFDDDFGLTFGLGLHFGDFTLDALIDEGLFFDGPNFISGTNEVMSTQLSLLYNF